MALVFSDEFEGTLGSDPPAGWTKTPPATANATVSTGGYHNQCVNFGPGGSIYQTMSSTYSAVSAFVVTSGGGFVYTPISFAQKNVVGTTTTYTTLLSVTYASDYEIQLVDGGGAVNAFGEAGFHYKGQENVWTFLQVDATLSLGLIGTSSALKLVTAVRLNGERICTGTTTFLSTLAAQLDTIFLGGPGGSTSKVDSLYVYNPVLTPTIVTPNEAAGRKARVSQTLIEHLQLPNDPKARVSQTLIEHAQLPSDPKARVSQAVIELITLVGGGWDVYEA